MRALRRGQVRGVLGLVLLASAATGTMTSLIPVPKASAQTVEAGLQKVNAYIEAARMTERAVESWDRYRSWVNMKTGPTGKERYISYGMYDLPNYGAALLKEARAAADAKPSVASLDAAMTRYADAYEALAPVMNQASIYYERRGYEADKAAQGRTLHKRMVPLATAFLAERDTMMPELRVFVRDVKEQELAAIEAREGRSARWQVYQVMQAADRVTDLFPRDRPEAIDSETLDAKIRALGPQSPGAAFDEIIAGVAPPRNAVIDVKRFGAALEKYAEAVDLFESHTGEKPKQFAAFSRFPRQLLTMLRAFHAPLIKSNGREFEDGGPMVAQIANVHIAMFNAGNGLAGSQVRYLP